MEEKNNWWVFILIGGILGAIIFGHPKYDGLSAEEWHDEYSAVQDELDSITYALDQANQNIDEAKYYSWESYDEMGDALDNLETVEP